MYRVIIIEDDPMVAAINKQYVEIDPLFCVQRIFKNGLDALEYLKTASVDLIVLDYYTPLMNGAQFIDRLHGLGKAPSIIMVTSANDTDIVQNLLCRGIVDYLVKPFEYARFKMALDKFCQTRQLFEASRDGLNQQLIDQLVSAPAHAGLTQPRLAKGLNETTLNLIRNFLKENAGTAFTSEQIAEQIHLSRITIRRYVNYMVETGEVLSSIDYQTGGRPSIQYYYR